VGVGGGSGGWPEFVKVRLSLWHGTRHALNTLQTCVAGAVQTLGTCTSKDGKLYASAGFRYRRVVTSTHCCIRPVVPMKKYFRTPRQPLIRPITLQSATGQNLNLKRTKRAMWGLSLTVSGKRGLPGPISKRSRSPASWADAKRKILDLIIEWHSPFGRRPGASLTMAVKRHGAVWAQNETNDHHQVINPGYSPSPAGCGTLLRKCLAGSRTLTSHTRAHAVGCFHVESRG